MDNLKNGEAEEEAAMVDVQGECNCTQGGASVTEVPFACCFFFSGMGDFSCFLLHQCIFFHQQKNGFIVRQEKVFRGRKKKVGKIHWNRRQKAKAWDTGEWNSQIIADSFCGCFICHSWQLEHENSLTSFCVTFGGHLMVECSWNSREFAIFKFQDVFFELALHWRLGDIPFHVCNI